MNAICPAFTAFRIAFQDGYSLVANGLKGGVGTDSSVGLIQSENKVMKSLPSLRGLPQALAFEVATIGSYHILELAKFAASAWRCRSRTVDSLVVQLRLFR